MRQAIKLISSVALFFCAHPCFAQEEGWRNQGSFEHQFREKGGDSFVYKWNLHTIVLSSDSHFLKIDEKSFDLRDSKFESLNEADFSEAKIYVLDQDKSYVCFDFGFGGLLRSGSFQNVRGVIVLHREADKHISLLYLQGVKVECKQISVAKSS